MRKQIFDSVPPWVNLLYYMQRMDDVGEMKEENDKLLQSAFHKMNLAITPEEREAFNVFRNLLWELSDKTAGYLSLYEKRNLSQSLKSIVNQIPILSDE